MTRCTILAAHPLRHHFRNSLRGIAASGLDYRVLVPWRLGSTALTLAIKFMPRKESTLRFYAFEEVPAWRFHSLAAGPLLLASRAIAPEQVVPLFDFLCAREIERGRICCEFLHVYQDYMPRTVQAAARRGSRIITEQILNSSPAVRKLAREITESVGAKSCALDFAPSEQLNDEVLRLAEVAICPSKFVELGLEGRFAGRTCRIPYGVSLDMFAPRLKPDPTREFRMVARCTTLRKGLPMALEGLLVFTDSVWFKAWTGRLVVDFLGDLQTSRIVEKALEKLRNRARVEVLLGNRSRAEAADILGRAHAFLLPSLSEGMSLTVLEAAAAGAVPLISANCGQDDFEHGRHGLVMASFSSKEIASVIQQVIAAPEATESMRRQAIQWAHSRDWQVFESEIASLYRNLKASPHRSASQ